MYESIKEILLDLFRAPNTPPNPPVGTHASIRIFRASPNYLRYQMLILVCFMVFVGIVSFILGIILLVNEPMYGMIVCLLLGGLWFALFLGAHFLIRLEYDMRYYIVTDRSMRIRKGIWSIVEQTLTFLNIQNITVEQGPLERMFGIARLVVDTAGGGGSVASQQQGAPLRNYHRAVLSGLENAPELRDLMVDYLKNQPHVVGLGTSEDRNRVSPRSRNFQPNELNLLREILSEATLLRETMVKPS